MQDRTYADLKALIQALSGVGSFTTEEDANIVNFVNRRASQAYHMSPSWPRYLVSSEGRDINAYTLSGATASTSTSVNQNYKFLGTNDGNVGTVGTNVYQGVTTTTVIIYKDSNNAWLVQTGALAAIQSDGRYRVTAGTSQFTEADTLKKDVLENVTTWTPRAGSDSLLVEPKNLIPYA